LSEIALSEQKTGLIRLGIDLKKIDYVVALAGNPNTGKSTVFNALTGLRQHVGNWPGKTVARAEGLAIVQGKRLRLVDLPGTYSLLSRSVEEEIARNFLLFAKPDATILVVDASNLERNLNLVLQVLSITSKAVICLNLVDEAERKGIIVNAGALAQELKVPVIPCIATKGKGLKQLIETTKKVAEGTIINQMYHIPLKPEVQAAVEKLVPLVLEEFPGIDNPEWIALRLLDGDESILDSLKNSDSKIAREVTA
jgi:Fe2+ transport system protein B